VLAWHEEPTMNPIFRLINFTFAAILRSALHRLISRNLMLITVTGRRSGHTYTVPVSYQRQGRDVRVISVRSDRWWRNVRGGAPVVLQLQGREVKGQGRVIEDAREVLPQLTEHLQHSANAAKMLSVKRNGQGQFRPEDLRRVAERSVVVCIELAR
jgi:hypothetical protein